MTKICFVYKIAGCNERTIMAAINNLRDRIDNLHTTVMKIYAATCNPIETSKNFAGISTLPLISMEEFHKWENFVVDEEKKLIMVRNYFICRLMFLKYPSQITIFKIET